MSTVPTYFQDFVQLLLEKKLQRFEILAKRTGFWILSWRNHQQTAPAPEFRFRLAIVNRAFLRAQESFSLHFFANESSFRGVFRFCNFGTWLSQISGPKWSSSR